MPEEEGIALRGQKGFAGVEGIAMPSARLQRGFYSIVSLFIHTEAVSVCVCGGGWLFFLRRVFSFIPANLR